jgi:hypothetical protein
MSTQCRVPPFLSSTKPAGIRGGVSPSLGLQIVQGIPAEPQPHARSPSHGRSGWLLQTQPEPSHFQQTMTNPPILRAPLPHVGGGDSDQYRKAFQFGLGLHPSALLDPNQATNAVFGKPHRALTHCWSSTFDIGRIRIVRGAGVLPLMQHGRSSLSAEVIRSRRPRNLQIHRKIRKWRGVQSHGSVIR